MKKVSKKNISRKPIRFMVFVLVLLIGVVSVQLSTLYAQHLDNEDKILLLEEQITCEVEKQVNLMAKKQYMYSNDYVEELARERLGLIMPDEIIFIVE